MITQREMKHLTDSLALPSSKKRGTVEYKKINDLLSDRRQHTAEHGTIKENWGDDEEEFYPPVRKGTKFK